jgi:hypothetical protein
METEVDDDNAVHLPRLFLVSLTAQRQAPRGALECGGGGVVEVIDAEGESCDDGQVARAGGTDCPWGRVDRACYATPPLSPQYTSGYDGWMAVFISVPRHQTRSLPLLSPH